MFVTTCRTKAIGPKPLYTSSSSRFPPSHVVSGNAFHLPPAFSWWDPGIFFNNYEIISEMRNCETSSSDSIAVAAAAAVSSGNDGSGMVAARAAATSDVSCGCNRRYSSSTNEESKLL